MKITIILFFINTFSGMGYSILAPLFPSLGTKDGLTESIIGWIISIFAMSNTLITPFTPYLCNKYGRIQLLYFSTFCEATCTILYGFLSLIKSFYPLIILMFLIRIIHGCCCGIIGTLVYSLTISLSNKEETKTSLGNLEIGWCIGSTCGPVFASLFYKIGGYPLPFIALGIFMYISVYLAFQVGHKKTESDEGIEEDPEIIKFLKYLDINIIIGSLIFGIVGQTFYFPSLTIHLEKNFGLSVSISSLFFVIQAIAYFLAVQYLDKTTKSFGLYGSSCLGMTLTSLGVLMVYPFPPLPKNIIIIIIGFVFIGGGDVPIFIPGIILLSKNIKKVNPNIDILTANDISSAINNLAFAIGDFIGPIIGGFLSTHVGFKYCCLIVSSIICLYCILFLIYFYKYIFIHFYKLGDDNIENNINKDEEKELMNHPGIYKNEDIESSLLKSKIKSLGEKSYPSTEIENIKETEVDNQYIRLPDYN